MSQEREEEPDDREGGRKDDPPDLHPDVPWWAGFGPLGAAALVLFGVAAGLWVFLDLPGSPDMAAVGYLNAGKVVAIGLVLSGTAAFNRLRKRHASREDEGDGA